MMNPVSALFAIIVLSFIPAFAGPNYFFHTLGRLVSGCVDGSQTFSYTGSNQTFTVPDGCTSISVKMWGAAGAGSYAGGGGFSRASLNVTAGENLTVIVGGSGGFGGGGSGICGGSTGGGRSALRRSTTELMTAGGGGGSGTQSGIPGGAGGGASGVAGHGAGGTQSAGGGAGGGCSGVPYEGSAFQGGNGCNGGCTYGGGGGGGGYYGGGGGGGGTGAGTGGGGGSGYVPVDGTTTAGSGTTPGNNTDVDYLAGIGVGGSNGNGYVKIYWSGSSCPFGGKSVNGTCWYLGTTGASCTTACASTGMQYDPQTQSYAGNTGSNVQCDAVLDALGIGTGISTTNLSLSAIGCAWNSGSSTRRRGTSATTAAATNASYSRACACFIPDYVPSAIDWANFNDYSSAQTINGLNTSISLQISAANTSGTPDLYYRKNGGTWTLFTTGSPATVSMANGNTLEFRVIGDIGNAANFTITNTSDSNTVLDTVTGTVATAADVVPDAIDWADFSTLSTNETFAGLERPMTVEISTANTSGSPAVYYSTDNGTNWTNVVVGTPATLTGVTNGSTLKFWVTGTTGNLATITIKNKTGALNTVIDTVVGSAVTCSGANYNGYCYVYGATAASCDTACASVGMLCELTGTRANVTTVGKCSDLLNALGANDPVGGTTNSGMLAYACAFTAPDTVHIASSSSNVTCAGSNASVRRACACFLPDYVPATVNWPDFNDASISQTFTGINTSISLQISATNGSGVADLYYRKNGGSWVYFTTSSPGATTVVSGDTLEFRMIGDIGDTSTFTITNTSSSNTVLDTVTGTVTVAGDLTPDAIDWADFSAISSTQTLTGFNRVLSVQLSAANSVGTPTIYYTTDGSTWNTITAGTPVNLTGILPGQTLRFRVDGTSTHAAAITVKNTTDGSNVTIDTMIGTVVGCGGATYGGNCFYLGSAGQSCDTVCANAGTVCNLAGTQAGTANQATCTAVLNALGVNTSGFNFNNFNTYLWACAYSSPNTQITNTVPSGTTCAATNASAIRACSCY